MKQKTHKIWRRHSSQKLAVITFNEVKKVQKSRQDTTRSKYVRCQGFIAFSADSRASLMDVVMSNLAAAFFVDNVVHDSVYCVSGSSGHVHRR